MSKSEQTVRFLIFRIKEQVLKDFHIQVDVFNSIGVHKYIYQNIAQIYYLQFLHTPTIIHYFILTKHKTNSARTPDIN